MAKKLKAGTTVLIVEDDPFLRFDSLEALEAEGMEVLEAANASEALAILGYRADVQVLFTDINMAGNVDGLELARIVTTRFRHIRIVVTSGHVKLRNSDLPSGMSFVPKPYPRNELVDLLS